MYVRYDFVFSQTDKRPMYQQIIEQITRRIAVGDWPPDTPLPSIRQLAAQIKVSIITVKRAYLELEREGTIVTQQGKGSRVNNMLNMGQLQRKELSEHLEHVAKLAKSLDIPEDDLMQMVRKYL